MPDSSCGSGAQCCLWRPDPGAKLLAPSWRHSPRVAAPTENACGLHNGAACTGWICGAPTPGRSFSGTELAPFAAGRGSHRRKGATCTTQRYARAGFVGPRPRAKLWRRAGAIRRGSRLPQKKGCDLHNVAPCTGSICRSPDLGAKLWHRAGVIRRGSRLLQKKGCDLYNAALCTGWICGSPDLGAKLWHRAGAIRRGSRLPQKKRATCTTQRHAWTRFVGGPPSGRSFWRRAGAIRRGSRLPQRERRVLLFVGGPASGEALSDRAVHANAGSSAGRIRSARSPASCVRRACRRRGCVRFRADAPAHGRRSFAGTPVPLP